jgi:hypothetical protein
MIILNLRFPGRQHFPQNKGLSGSPPECPECPPADAFKKAGTMVPALKIQTVS